MPSSGEQKMVTNSQLTGEQASPAYGAMRSVMGDHVYVPCEHAQIFTTPCINALVTTPFDVLVGITACRRPFLLSNRNSSVESAASAAGARERRIVGKGVKLVIVQLHPLHPVYRLFRRQHSVVQLDREQLSSCDAHLDAAYRGTLSLAGSQELCNEVVALLSRQLPAVPPLDERVKKTMQLLFADPRLHVEELAASNGLSYDRMSHLFMDDLGISIRSFQVWVKLRRALTGIRYGQSLIELAQLAGFSDAAHLSRVYKQVYGAPPSYFYYSENVKLVASFLGEIPGTPPSVIEQPQAVYRAAVAH
jgi:AraC-like DNA-binding protein